MDRLIYRIDRMIIRAIAMWYNKSKYNLTNSNAMTDGEDQKYQQQNQNSFHEINLVPQQNYT